MSAEGMREESTQLRFGWWPRATVVRQEHASECGLACIGMLLNFHGNPISLSELRQKLSLSGRGMTMAQLVRAADQMNLQTRALRIEIDDLRNLRFPAIAHINGNHFVVLTRVGRRKVRVLDPASGHREISWKRFGEMFTGVVLEAFPSPLFTPAGTKGHLEKPPQFCDDVVGPTLT